MKLFQVQRKIDRFRSVYFLNLNTMEVIISLYLSVVHLKNATTYLLIVKDCNR